MRKFLLYVLACLLPVMLAGCLNLTSHTVSTPDRPSGPTSGAVGQSLAYSTGGASCSQGHPIQYRFDWGDGTYSSWSFSMSASKSWDSAGTYSVRVQARCSSDTSVVSGWSSAMSVTISAVSTACVTVRQLLDEFAANEVAARMKYEGKRTAICGYVDGVKVNDFTGQPYVILTDSPTAFRLTWVFCYFPESAMPRLAQLHKGDYVTISGVFDDYVLGSVFMENCTLP